LFTTDRRVLVTCHDLRLVGAEGDTRQGTGFIEPVVPLNQERVPWIPDWAFLPMVETQLASCNPRKAHIEDSNAVDTVLVWGLVQATKRMTADG
jgi:hypothetical protein